MLYGNHIPNLLVRMTRSSVTRQSIIKVWLVERLKAEAGGVRHAARRGQRQHT